jgi:hypothetical protein
MIYEKFIFLPTANAKLGRSFRLSDVGTCTFLLVMPAYKIYAFSRAVVFLRERKKIMQNGIPLSERQRVWNPLHDFYDFATRNSRRTEWEYIL